MEFQERVAPRQAVDGSPKNQELKIGRHQDNLANKIGIIELYMIEKEMDEHEGLHEIQWSWMDLPIEHDDYQRWAEATTIRGIIVAEEASEDGSLINKEYRHDQW